MPAKRSPDAHRPKYKPSDEQRRTVQGMIGLGDTQANIALVLDIDPKTLRLHFRRELDTGVIIANSRVKQSLFQQARKGNVVAAIYWTKVRCGWSEKQEVQLTGANGGPMTFRWADPPPPSKS